VGREQTDRTVMGTAISQPLEDGWKLTSRASGFDAIVRRVLC